LFKILYLTLTETLKIKTFLLPFLVAVLLERDSEIIA
jgi:hypothetical protein